MYESYTSLNETLSLLKEIEVAFNEKIVDCDTSGKKYFYHGMVEARRMIDFIESRLYDLKNSTDL